MAFIYFNGKKYFPILDFYSSDLMNLSNNSSSVLFEVDELMALPVAELNNKGYLTEMCCSGHAVGNLCCEVADTDDLEELRSAGLLIAVQYLKEYEAEYMCWQGAPSIGAFIMFKNRIHFSTIPNGWTYDIRRCRLSCEVSKDGNPMTYYKNISHALESLMAWIMQLPSICSYEE